MKMNRTMTEEKLGEILTDVTRLIMPAWPLQNAVAVNPFWNYRDEKFDRVLETLSPALRTSLYMPLTWYREKLRAGEISLAALERARAEAMTVAPHFPADLDSFLEASRGEGADIPARPTFAEFAAADNYWQRVIAHETGKHAAAFFDTRQALARPPWQTGSFWETWLAAQRMDRAMITAGIPRFAAYLAPLENISSATEAIAFLLGEMELSEPAAIRNYLERLLATVSGWASQFGYHEWQSGRGLAEKPTSSVEELLAVRLACDYGVYCLVREEGREPDLNRWRRFYQDGNNMVKGSPRLHRLEDVWQRALEYSLQDRLAGGLKPGKLEKTGHPEIQVAFCIDVRSETLRHQLERAEPFLETIGFAGFFGLPLEYQAAGEDEFGQRLPVLLPPAYRSGDCRLDHNHGADKKDPTRKNIREKGKLRIAGGNESHTISFFRNLRKGPLSSFLFVELFGLLSIGNIVRSTFFSLIRRLRDRRTPGRFEGRSGAGPDHHALLDGGGVPLSAEAKAERAASILRHMGIHDRAAGLVVLAGHGSATVNNAFGSALDCGACGGHAGDVNARLVAGMLNDPAVREHLPAHGIDLPAGTWFTVAVHETVTDDLYFTDEETIPAEQASRLERLKRALKKAAPRTRAARQVLVSDVLDKHAARRRRNWAEIRPEWGLTGNAAFIVAPRYRTRESDLGGRVFLHDYDWRRDENFATLELILTAPMVVTNWINLQYYASTVANGVYGAGNKVLHNLVNEAGVLEGNGGDLRVGLPWQSIHDGERFTHDPVRLSVFVEAPRAEIEKIIGKHAVVRQLVDNEWLYLLHIDPETGKTASRKPGGEYE